MRQNYDGVVLVSGGMDSITLLHYIKNEYPVAKIHALNMYYGQRHKKEQEYCKYWCDFLNVPYTEYNLSFYYDMIKDVSAMVENDLEVPEKEYDPNETPVTYAPFRNLLFVIIGSIYCECHGLKKIYYAGHAGDAGANYWDTTVEFLNKTNELLAMRGIELVAPFINITKGSIAKIAKHYKDLDLSKTWSCYKGEDVHCGVCSTCRERILAMIEAGIEDKTEYKENPYK